MKYTLSDVHVFVSCPALFVTWFSLQYELWVPFQCHSEPQWGRGAVPLCARSLFTLWEHWLLWAHRLQQDLSIGNTADRHVSLFHRDHSRRTVSPRKRLLEVAVQNPHLCCVDCHHHCSAELFNKKRKTKALVVFFFFVCTWSDFRCVGVTLILNHNIGWWQRWPGNSTWFSVVNLALVVHERHLISVSLSWNV